MQTTTLRPVKNYPQHLADQLSQFDRDIETNADYVKNSIDYNDNKLTSWLGKSSVEFIQVEQILRAYVQLVLTNRIESYEPKNYPAKYIEMIGASASQESSLALRCIKIMYWGVKQNRIPTNAILYPQNKVNDPNYRIPDEPHFLQRLENNITQIGGDLFNKAGRLATGIVDTTGKIIDGVGDTSEGLGVLGKYGVPVAVGGAALVIVYFGYNIARTSTAGHVVKAIPKVK